MLEGRVAVITGAARGIGRAIAMGFAAEGARVAIADVIDGRPARDEIEARGGRALNLNTDVASEESTKAMAQAVVDELGAIDILVNNAGIFASLGKKPFTRISAEEWDTVLAVNLKGMFLCCKAVYPHMKSRGGGKIINMASSAFFQGVPGYLHYVASKGGVIGLTRALARELGDDGIAVNAIAPGLTASEVVLENPMYPEDYLHASAESRSFKRIEVPEDLVGAALFLASAMSGFVTGQTINVDGGGSFH